MARLLLLLIIIIPAIEVTVLILAGKMMGIFPTFLLIILTAVIGIWFARREGMQVIRLAQLQVQQGQMPSGTLLDGICILIGGFFLLMPGLVTDLIGFLLLIPFTRTIAKGFLIYLFTKMIKKGQLVVMTRR